jgi:hypothetical protein
MSLVVPNPSEVKLLEFALGFSTPGNQLLKLFTNNVTPGDTDTAATYTEMSTQNYAAKTLNKANWSIASSSGVGTASYAAQTWTFDGSGGATTVYGYYVVDATTGTLLWSELFNSPKVVQYAGDQIVITPAFTLSKV